MYAQITSKEQRKGLTVAQQRQAAKDARDLLEGEELREKMGARQCSILGMSIYSKVEIALVNAVTPTVAPGGVVNHPSDARQTGSAPGQAPQAMMTTRRARRQREKGSGTGRAPADRAGRPPFRLFRNRTLPVPSMERMRPAFRLN